MSAPWKELLLFYQQKEDARIKYEQVIEQFEPTGILDERLQTGGPNDVPMFRPEDELVVSSVGYSEEIGRAHVWTQVTNAQLVCRLLLDKKKSSKRRPREQH